MTEIITCPKCGAELKVQKNQITARCRKCSAWLVKGGKRNEYDSENSNNGVSGKPVRGNVAGNDIYERDDIPKHVRRRLDGGVFKYVSLADQHTGGKT